jgi:hypothetical protein
VDENDNPVASGHCGAKNEITRVTEPTPPPGAPGYTFTPFMPDSGFIARQIVKIILLGGLIAAGAWQLTSKNSWVFKSR